eukprot:Nk52_evm16s485 gene=Nk52_evmTU16s485
MTIAKSDSINDAQKRKLSEQQQESSVVKDAEKESKMEKNGVQSEEKRVKKMKSDSDVSVESRGDASLIGVEDYDVVLLDIEGTTTKLSFVRECLFPFFKKHFEDYLRREKWSCEKKGSEDEEEKELTEVWKDLVLLREQSLQDEKDQLEGVVVIPEICEENKEGIIAKVKENVLWQMGSDRKAKALKQFQGHVWRDLYAQGLVKSHIYEDVESAMDKWIELGKKIYIYSSGSVEAQKLLFGHTTEGSLLPKLSGYFDTSIGSKLEKDSYTAICKEIACCDANERDIEAGKSNEDQRAIGTTPQRVLFLTDNVLEVAAARSVGVNAFVCCRPENPKLTEQQKKDFICFKTFLDFFSANIVEA